MGQHGFLHPELLELLVGRRCNDGRPVSCSDWMAYAPNARIIRVMCSGRIDPQFILSAFRNHADGVLLGGCHPGDCHYQEGNHKALRRYHLLQRFLAQMGIEKERLRLEWISASEGEKVKRVIDEMTEQLRRLGPLSGDGKATTPQSIEVEAEALA